MRITYNHCNGRNYCPSCAYRYASKRAYETYEFLQENVVKKLRFKVYAMHLVLTLPHDIEVSDSEFRSMIKELIHRGDQTTYITSIQDYSSSDPLHKHKHAHIFTLNVAMTNEKTVIWIIRRLRPYFNVEYLRLRWKSIIEKHTGSIIEGEVDLKVHYTLFRNKTRVIRWLRYLYRYPVWDLFKYVVRGEKDGPFNNASCGNGARSVYVHYSSMTLGPLFDRKVKVTWSGFLSNSTRYQNIWIFGKPCFTLADIRESIFVRNNSCPICHAPLMRVQSVYGPPEPVGEDSVACLMQLAKTLQEHGVA